MDDLTLLGRVARRDRSAFQDLFRRYAPRLVGWMRQVPRHVAEDLAQDVMLRVWQRAPTFDPSRSAPATWIFAIARNARIDLFRRAERAEAEPADPEWVADPSASPEAVALHVRRFERLQTLVAGLSVAQVDMLERIYLRGQTLAEAADELGVPLGTAKSRVRLAMDALRARWALPTVRPSRDQDGRRG